METFLDTDYDLPTEEWCGCYGPHEKNSLPSGKSRVSGSKILLSLLFLFLFACEPQISAVNAPQEDSVEASVIWARAEWEWIDLEIPCNPQKIYEVYQDHSVYIGVVGECTDASIGMFYPPSGPPIFEANAAT